MSQDGGQWQVKKSSIQGVSKGQHVLVELGPAAVTVRTADGSYIATGTLEQAVFENWGGGQAMLELDGNRIEIEQVGTVSPLDLQESIYVRRAPVSQESKICPDCRHDVPFFNDHCYNCGYDYPPDPSAPPRAQPKSRYPSLEASLAVASHAWTAPVVLRQYRNDKDGRTLFAQDIEVFGLFGYTPATQTEDGGHVHVGRLLMTGGLSIFAGKRGVRSDGTIAVTFQKSPDQPAAASASTGSGEASSSAAGVDALAMLEKLGQLHDAGVLTEVEFETKKAELLARL
jgi:Short C-terminal domain